MLNWIISGANMIIQPKRNKPNNQQQQWGGQQQGGWGGQQQGGWGGQQQGWGQQQGGWGQQDWGNNNNTGGGGLGIMNQNSQQTWGNNAEGAQWIQEQKKRQNFNIVDPRQQPNINVNDVIGEQVVFIQPSPAQKRLDELKRTGQPFIDEMFPASPASLYGEYQQDSDWSSIKWRRVTQVMKNPVLFSKKIGPSDIKQGYLGDCYFLAGLAAIVERPDRIFNLFLLRELNQQRYFSVKMLYKGKWMTVDMDEYIPCIGNTPAFSRANQDELWVILLEKAWAKLYTSYKRVEAGYPEQTLHDLTGAPIRQILLKNANFNKQQEWQYLLDASAREYAMVASSNPGSDTNKSVSGVVQGHAYTVLNAAVITFQGRPQRIVQLRNPWGKGQFTGKWSDLDQNWNAISQQERQRIGFNPQRDDGLFWMPYDAFCQQFRSVTVAEVDDNASYVYKSVKDQQCKGVYFAVDILKQDLYSFQVDKTPERIYPQKYQQIFQYPQALIQIGRIQGNQCQKYQGLRSSKRTLIQKQKLAPGKYVVFVRISYNPDFEDKYDVNLAVYAPTVCNIQLATRQEAAIFTGNPNVQWTGEDVKSKEPWNAMGNINTEQQQPQQQQQQQQQQQNWEGETVNFGGQGQQQQWGGQGQQQQSWGGQQGWDGQGQGQQQGWGGQGQQQQGGWSGQQQQWGGQGQQQQGWGGQQGANNWGQQGW